MDALVHWLAAFIAFCMFVHALNAALRTALQNSARNVTNSATAIQTILNTRQSVVIQHDHWLMDVLCQAKRIEFQSLRSHDKAMAIGVATESLQDDKASDVRELLAAIRRLDTRSSTGNDNVTEIQLSERVVRLASVFSDQLPAYEPLLVEVALVHCLHEWSSSSDKTTTGAEESEDDVVADFETYFLSQLESDEAANWFNCQFSIDSLDLLCMAPLFYKHKIQNPALKDLISISFVETNKGDAVAGCSKLLVHLTKKENEPAQRAWYAWLRQEGATMETLRCESTTTAKAAATATAAQRRSYFPMSGGKYSSSCYYYAGFIHRRDKLSDGMAATHQKQE